MSKLRLLPPVQISTNPKVNQDAQAWAQQNNDQLERFLNASIFGSRLQWSLGTSPPASATTGDFWIYPGSDFYWLFMYDASEATNKWKFIGGPPVVATIATFETTTSTTVVDLATVGPSITLPRAGDYTYTMGSVLRNATAGDYAVAEMSFAGTISGADYIAASSAYTANMFSSASRGPVRRNGAAASDVWKLVYRSGGGGTAGFDQRFLAVQPVRVI